MPEVESSDTLRTTKTMREKAKAVSRCFIMLLKCMRRCKGNKTNKDPK